MLPKDAKIIDLSDRVSTIPPATEKDFLFISYPSLDLVKEAERLGLFIVIMVPTNLFPQTVDALRAFREERGLPESSYIMLCPYVPSANYENERERITKQLIELWNTQPSPWYAPAGYKRSTDKLEPLYPKPPVIDCSHIHCLWPDGTMCTKEELHEMTHMSDDYELVEVTEYASDGSPVKWIPYAHH